MANELDCDIVVSDYITPEVSYAFKQRDQTKTFALWQDTFCKRISLSPNQFSIDRIKKISRILICTSALFIYVKIAIPPTLSK